jgi:hypothetical protein
MTDVETAGALRSEVSAVQTFRKTARATGAPEEASR